MINLLLIFGFLSVLVINHPLRIPEILSDQIELRLARLNPDLDLDIEAINLQLEHGWRPAILLRNVDVTDAATGQAIVTVETLGAALAIRPLIRGQVQPRRLWLSGAVGQIRRGPDGTAELSFGSSPALVSAAFGPELLMKEWERLFQLPQMAALRDVDVQNVSIQYTDQSRNWAATLDDGQIRVRRTGRAVKVDSSFAMLSGGQSVSTLTLRYGTEIGSLASEFAVDIEDVPARALAIQSPGLEWLSVLRAPISGRVSGKVRADGSLAPALASLEISAGVLQPTEAARPIPFDYALAQIRYDAGEQVIYFDRLAVNSPALTASASGVAQAELRTDRLALDQLTGQFAVAEIRIEAEELYDHPVFLQGLSSDFQVGLNPFRLTLAGTQISDQTSAIRISGDITSDAAGWGVNMQAGFDEMSADQVLALWPLSVIPKARDWVSERVAAGILRDADVMVRGQGGAKPMVVADFTFTDANVRFLKTMPPVTDATGQVSFDDGRFVASVTKGLVNSGEHGAIDAAGTSFIIPDTDVGEMSPSITRLSLRGPVAAAMALLNRPPLEVLKATTLPVDLAEGQVEVTGTIATPMAPKVPPEMIRFHLNGEIRDVHSTVLVPDHEITAQMLELRATQDGVEVGGAAEISGVPATMRWSQPLGPKGNGRSQVTGQIALTQDTLDAFQVALPPQTVSGQGEATVRVDLGGGAPPRLRLSSDLRGVGLSVPPLGWRKPAGQGGDLSVEVSLGPDPQVDRIELSTAGLNFDGQVRLRDGALEAVDIRKLSIGSWLDTRGELIGRGVGRSPDIRLTGGRLDMRGFAPFPGPAGDSQPGTLGVSLDQLILTDNISIWAMQGGFDLAGGLSGPYSGRVNGSAGITGTVETESDGSVAVRVESEDAGRLMEAIGILRRASGGRLDMALRRLPSGRIDGEARMDGAMVLHDAPTLAAVLNTITIFGVVTELSGGGIWFRQAEAGFSIATNGLVSIYDAIAEGPTVGLTLDGRVDTRAGILDLRGVISPFYVLNALGGVVSQRGEGLIGVTFDVNGPVSNPKVRANLLSALLPGGLRDLFRSQGQPTAPSDRARELLPEPPEPERDPFAPSPGEDR